MNILLDPLPDSVTVRGERCPVNTDWRAWLRFGVLMERAQSEPSVLAEVITTVYKCVPPNLYDAITAAAEFYAPRVGDGQHGGTGNGASPARAYDVECDADMIYAAFYQQYGIDLAVSDMHWYRFRALFSALGEDVQFVKAISYRTMNLDEIRDPKTRGAYRRLKEQYALPDRRTEEERLCEMYEILANF